MAQDGASRATVAIVVTGLTIAQNGGTQAEGLVVGLCALLLVCLPQNINPLVKTVDFENLSLKLIFISEKLIVMLESLLLF